MLRLDREEEPFRGGVLARAIGGELVVQVERAGGVFGCADVEKAREVSEVVGHVRLLKCKSPARGRAAKRDWREGRGAAGTAPRDHSFGGDQGRFVVLDCVTGVLIVLGEEIRQGVVIARDLVRGRLATFGSGKAQRLRQPARVGQQALGLLGHVAFLQMLDELGGPLACAFANRFKDARLGHAVVSATGATTVHNLAYAQRLGLWGGEDFPFATRAEFVEAIEDGGVAAMEVLARDLRSLGLYTSRSLSYDGVEYELVEHELTPEQVGIYDAYAEAFAVIHNNLDAAMQAANITGSDGTLNKQAKSAARSAFESAKQRFFGHLLTSMRTPTLIRRIERDLADGHAAVIQIVSTGEALMERRLAEIPTEEWNDVRVDITPREYVLDYLAHSFPVQLYEPFTDSEGNLSSRPVYRDGQPVESREAGHFPCACL